MSFAAMLAMYSHRIGLVHHLAYQACALHKVASTTGIRAYVAAPAWEHVPGLWELVRGSYPDDQVFVLENETNSLAQATSRLLEREARVVVHVQGNQQLRPLIGLKRQHPDRLKIVYTVRSFRNATWQRIPYSWAVSWLLRRYVDYTTFHTPYSVGEFVNSDKVLRNGRGGIVPIGVEDYSEHTDNAPGESQLDPALRAILHDPKAFRFLYLATIHRGKGHRWLIEGLAPILRRHPQAYLIMAGSSDARILAGLQTLTHRLAVASQVLFPGYIDRNYVPWLIDRIHVGIVASRSETFGRAVIEPMAGGKTVISTRKGIAQWLVMDYLTGFGIQYRDRAALGAAAEYVVSHPDEAVRMGRTAAELVRNILTWENIASSHLRIYQSLWPSDA
jgi:glycosyltransferase involved in cell wall biosynthesis